MRRKKRRSFFLFPCLSGGVWVGGIVYRVRFIFGGVPEDEELDEEEGEEEDDG